MAKETFRSKDKFRNTFLAMIVAGAMKGPIENLSRQIEEDPSFVDAQKTPIHTLYLPQVSNEEKFNTPTPAFESTLAANRQPIHELSLALETTPTITLSPVGSPSPETTPRPTPTANPTPVVIIQEKSAEKEVEVCRPVFWGDRNQPEVALTFDDGFSAQAIQTTLEILRANNIQGTFFVVGTQLEAYPDLWQQAVADGHQICNHTYTHTYLSSLSGEEIKKELARWETAAGGVLGEEYVERMKQEFAYVRFPGGAGHNSEGVLEAVAEAGYRPIAWSQETYAAVLKSHDLKNEAVAPIADEVRQYTVNTAQNGAIILLHFNSWDTLYLEQIVEDLTKKGLTPTSVSKVLD